MPFITYTNSTKKLDRVFSTQAEADNRANTRGIRSHNGEITTASRQGQTIDAINVSQSEDWWYNAGADPLLQDHDPAITDELIAARDEIEDTHVWLNRQYDLAVGADKYYPNADVDFIKDEIPHVHAFMYAVANDSRYTLAQVKAVAANIRMGTAAGTVSGTPVPALATSLDLLDALPALRAAGGASPITLPFGWVNPADGTRWNALEARANTAALNLTAPAPRVLRNGMWIQSWTK